MSLQVETGKDNGKSHSWVDGSEVEADRWVNTADAAALDAWGKETSPEPASRGTAELQALGKYAHHRRLSCHATCAYRQKCCAWLRLVSGMRTLLQLAYQPFTQWWPLTYWGHLALSADFWQGGC